MISAPAASASLASASPERSSLLPAATDVEMVMIAVFIARPRVVGPCASGGVRTRESAQRGPSLVKKPVRTPTPHPAGLSPLPGLPGEGDVILPPVRLLVARAQAPLVG